MVGANSTAEETIDKELENERLVCVFDPTRRDVGLAEPIH